MPTSTPPSTTPHFTAIIRDQIGLGTLMTVGARDFIYSDHDGDRWWQFTVTGKRGYISVIKVILEPSDTYTVKLDRMNKRTYDGENVHTADLVYADSLAGVVRRFCGE